MHASTEATDRGVTIVQRRGLYAHPRKSETPDMGEGEMVAFVSDEDGDVVDARQLSPDGFFPHRAAERTFHSIAPLTPMIVRHGGKRGSFAPEPHAVAAS